MRKLIFSILVAVLVIGCASTNVADFKGKDWKLVEVWVDNKNIDFNRKDLTNDKAGDIFTVKFTAETLAGTGASNRYSAPYTLDGQNVSVMPIRSTMMASLWQPEKLREHDFLFYMQNLSEWTVANGKLELTSKTEDGRSVKLVFSL
jgi:heat shock protein HslJ